VAADKPSNPDVEKRLEVNEVNVIRVTFLALSEEDQHQVKEEMRRELEEVEVTKLWESTKASCKRKRAPRHRYLR
jgi:hypothetical protein